MNQTNKVEVESDQINSQKECTVNPSETSTSSTATKRKHSETESETEVEVTKRKKDLYSEFNDKQQKYFNRYIEDTANFIESALEDYLLDEDFYEDFDEEYFCFFGHGQTPIYWLKFFFCVESLSEDEKKKYNLYFENVLRKSDINIHGFNPNDSRRKRFIDVMDSHLDDFIQFGSLEKEYTLNKMNEDRFKVDLLKSFYTNVMKKKDSEFTIEAVLPLLQDYQGKKVSMRMEERYRSYGDEDDAPCCSTMEKTGYCGGH